RGLLVGVIAQGRVPVEGGVALDEGLHGLPNRPLDVALGVGRELLRAVGLELEAARQRGRAGVQPARRELGQGEVDLLVLEHVRRRDRAGGIVPPRDAGTPSRGEWEAADPAPVDDAVGGPRHAFPATWVSEAGTTSAQVSAPSFSGCSRASAGGRRAWKSAPRSREAARSPPPNPMLAATSRASALRRATPRGRRRSFGGRVGLMDSPRCADASRARIAGARERLAANPASEADNCPEAT